MLVAVSVVAIFAFSGLLSWTGFWNFALHFWVGDMIGIAGFTPLVLLMMDAHRRATITRGSRPREHLLQLCVIAFGLWIIFGWEPTDHFEYSYVLFLPLIWIALRGGLVGATWGILATQLGLVLAIQIKGFDADVSDSVPTAHAGGRRHRPGSRLHRGRRTTSRSSLRDSETRFADRGRNRARCHL
jgi:hypothetical protein